jgi:Capsule polysaccharide biosynthesis protein
MNTFILPGEMPHLSRIRGYLSDEVCGILVHKKLSVAEVQASGVVPGDFSGKVYTLNSLVELTAEVLEEADRFVYEKCLAKILADQRVHYLATRSHLNSPFNNTIVIERILVNSILIIRKTKPLRLVSGSTPHSVEAWIFAKCFEHLNLPVYVLERTPINDRVWIYRGLDRQEVVPVTAATPAAVLSASSLKLLKEQRGSKPGEKDASGFYLSRMDLSTVKGADSNAWWSYRREFGFLRPGRIITLPLRLLSFYVKRLLYKSYCEVVARELPETPFVVYFMHYQPERSSLPEGLLFVQQWLAVRLLSWSLPAGWTLVVREHPTTWLQPLDITARTPSLYREFASLPNTRVRSMDADTFEVIDKCAAVATLTGSVGFQSLLRNKPVLAFGLPAYKDHPACFSISSLADLEKALGVIQREDLGGRFSDAALIDYLSWVERHSFCADPNEPDWLEARLKNFSEIYRQLFSGRLELP